MNDFWKKYLKSLTKDIATGKEKEHSISFGEQVYISPVVVSKDDDQRDFYRFSVMEFEGEYAHNMVRKIRWANYPFVPGIAENINSEWPEERLDAWVVTCTQCHSERFARSYLDLMDKGTLQGLAKYQDAHEVVEKLYEEGLLAGQKTT